MQPHADPSQMLDQNIFSKLDIRVKLRDIQIEWVKKSKFFNVSISKRERFYLEAFLGNI